jgi:hypothetical protein
LETIRFGQNLAGSQTYRPELVFRKITSTCSQIVPGVAQYIDQLKSHSVPPAEHKHFVLA